MFHLPICVQKITITHASSMGDCQIYSFIDKSIYGLSTMLLYLPR